MGVEKKWRWNSRSWLETCTIVWQGKIR